MADLSFTSPLPYYWMFLGVLAVLLGVTWMSRSRMGYYLRAIRGGERAARSLGVKVRRYKLYALLLSAGFTSLAGSLYATMIGFIDPDSGLGILISVKMVIIAALGGAGTLFGPLAGAIILVPLEEWTNAAFGGGGTGITYWSMARIIMLVAASQPGGLAEILQRLRRTPGAPPCCLKRGASSRRSAASVRGGADFTSNKGEIVGLIGPNGAGKSTFFNCLAGDTRTDRRAHPLRGADVTRATPEEHARLGIGPDLPGAGDVRGHDGASRTSWSAPSCAIPHRAAAARGR